MTRRWSSLRLYIGICTSIDEVRTLECTLDVLEVGCDDALLLVSLMVDAPVATNRIRESITEEETRAYIEYSKVSMNEYGRLCVPSVYIVPPSA